VTAYVAVVSSTGSDSAKEVATYPEGALGMAVKSDSATSTLVKVMLN
jgi:hypothetical protein